MQKITPFLWFTDQAEEAVKFYASIFKNSKIGRILRYGEEATKVSESGRPVGSVLTIEFEIEGQKFVALNGGPQFKFNESVSFVVNCETQEEVDYFWEKLKSDGDRSQYRALSMNKEFTSGYAPVNGLNIYYEIHSVADERKTPLVLLHGGGDTIQTSL